MLRVSKCNNVLLKLVVLVLLLLGTSTVSGKQAQDPLKAAAQHIRGGRMSQAEKLLRGVTTSDPDNGRAWYLLGFALHAQQKYARALPAHLEAAKHDTFTARASYNAACAYARQGKRDSAIAMLTKATELQAVTRAQLLGDSDLISLHRDPQFVALLPKPIPESELFTEPATILRSFYGETANDEFGWVARRIGDVDDDGAIDFVTTAPSFGNGRGKIYVYSSRSGQLVYSKTGTSGERLGSGAAGAGDVDNDGLPDVIVGAPSFANSTQPGSAYVLSGSTGDVLHRFAGESAGDRFGYKACGVGDIDDDGHADVAVSGIRAASGKGRVCAYSGKTGQRLFVLDGDAAGDQFGSALAGTENGDRPALIVGAQDAGSGKAGRAYVYTLDGDNAALAFTVDPLPGNVELGQMFVSFLGDVDGDEVSDVYVSDFSDRSRAPIIGAIRIHSGSPHPRFVAARRIRHITE